MSTDALAPVRGRRGVFGLSLSNQVVTILCLMYLLMYIDRVNIATAAPRMMADLALDNTRFGLAVSAFAYPYALCQLLCGWISDRFGPRRALLMSGLIVCLATICTGLVGGLGSLLAARVVLGFGEGFAFPTATRALSVWLPRERWGFGQGITHAASRLGNALSPPLVAGIMAYTSWRGSFVALGLVGLLWVALWWWTYRDDPRRHERISADELAHLPPPPATAGGIAAAIPWFKLARRILPVTAVDFCYGWTLWVFLTWLPSFFYQNFHLDLKHSALFSGGVLAAGVIGDTSGGVISDRLYRWTGSLQVARRNLIVVGMLGAFGFLIAVVLTQDLTTVALCLSGAFFFCELVVAPLWSVPMDIAPHYAGAASGMMNFGFGLAGIVSPVVFGALLDSTGSWSIPFYGSIGLLLLGAALAFFMRPDRPFPA